MITAESFKHLPKEEKDKAVKKMTDDKKKLIENNQTITK